MTTDRIEERVMSERRPQGSPPTPGNPVFEELVTEAKRVTVAEPLMYTGETREAFYARRQASESLWNGFMAAITPRGAVFGNDS